MNSVEIKAALQTFTVLIDTREQLTPRYYERIKAMGVPCERVKLDFGDYSARVTLPGGKVFSLAKTACIERKMNIDELCSCFGKERKRFENEFKRALSAGARVYLLLENTSWEQMYYGFYRSQMKPKALIASLAVWMTRYNCGVITCQPSVTGQIIRDILYREMKERLAEYGRA